MRTRRLATLTKERRAELDQRETNLTQVHTLIIKAGCEGARPEFYRGHAQLDETWFDSWARIEGTGTRQDKLGGADPEAAWRHDKKHEYSKYVHMFVFTQMATMPYERRVPNVVTGMRARPAKKESDVQAAVAAVRMHIANGFGPTPGRPGRIYTDRGYSEKLLFAAAMLDVGYQVVSSNEQPAPSKGFIRPEGPLLIGAKFACPAAIKLLKHRNLEPIDPDNATPAQLRERQDIIDAIRPFIMPTNGKPRLLPATSKHPARAVISLVCPASARQCDCPIVNELEDPTARLPYAYDAPDKEDVEHLPRTCQSTYSSVTVPVTFLKNLDQMLHGSFEHADHMMNIRSANERPHGYMKRRDMGSFSRDSIVMMGRARVSVAVAIVVALLSIGELEAINAKPGNSVHNLPHTPRLAAARQRNQQIADERHRNP